MTKKIINRLRKLFNYDRASASDADLHSEDTSETRVAKSAPSSCDKAPDNFESAVDTNTQKNKSRSKTKPKTEAYRKNYKAESSQSKNNNQSTEPPDSAERKSKTSKSSFSGTALDPLIVDAIEKLRFSSWTPIQESTLPLLLNNRDVAAQAQTGTGKTAAFLITIISRFLQNHQNEKQNRKTPFSLILAPTRELAIQIDSDLKSLAESTNIRHVGIYGGMDYDHQKRRLQQGVDVITATPGRLLDFSRKKVIDLGKIEILVLDEADRMLDMGFLPDIRRIIRQLPPREKRQNMLFSATLSQEIMRLASQWMNQPERIEIAPDTLVAKEVEHYAYPVQRREKLALLLWLLKNEAGDRVLIFCNRRLQCEKLTKQLLDYGINCAMLTGDVPQNKRLRVLEAFRKGTIRVVIATDVAGRGVHVDNISHVINYDIPDETEAYVHRIGRTGRAGISGRAISFACEDGGFMIPDIEEYLGEPIRMINPEEEMLKLPHPVHRMQRKAGEKGTASQERPLSSTRKRGRQTGQKRKR